MDPLPEDRRGWRVIIHNKGRKARRDRAILLSMYREMCRELHVKPLPAERLALASNNLLNGMVRDLYASAPTKVVNRIHKKRHKANEREMKRQLREARRREFWAKAWAAVVAFGAGLFTKKAPVVPKSKQTPNAIPFVGAKN